MAERYFNFSFERRSAYRRHQQITISPSDPNPDVQQDDNYATQRMKDTFGQFPFGVKALKRRGDLFSLGGYGVIAGILYHISHQFWGGLDAVAFIGLIATTLACAFSYRFSDDARYGGMHSFLWSVAIAFVLGRLVAVYANLYPGSIPTLGSAILHGLRTGTRLDDWIPFVAKAPLEWCLAVALVLNWRNREPTSATAPTEPPNIFFDRLTPPPQDDTRRIPRGVFALGYLFPILAPSVLTRADIYFATLAAAGTCLIFQYVLVVENTDYGKIEIQDPDITYPWLMTFSPRRFQIFEFLGLAVFRVLPPIIVGMFAAMWLGNVWCAGALVIAGYVLTAAAIAPKGSGNLFDRLLFIFRHYPETGGDRPQPGRFDMSPIVERFEDRDALVAMAAFSAGTAIYSLQTLIPTWPNVSRYWFFVTDLPPMDYTAIALSILFQAVGTAAFVKCIFVAAYGQLLHDRFVEERDR